MNADPEKPDVAIVRVPLIDGLGLGGGDAELGRGVTRLRVLVRRRRLDVGVDAEADGCDDPQAGRHLAKQLQLTGALDVKRENSRLEAGDHLLFGLPHPGEDHPVGRDAGAEHPPELAERDDVGSRSPSTDSVHRQ